MKGINNLTKAGFMKKLIAASLIALSFNAMAVYNAPSLNSLDMGAEEWEAAIDKAADIDKATFKKRLYPDYKLLVDIDTNFKAPVVGKGTYFGYIYIVPGNNTIVKYRDEITAEDSYKDEVNDPSSQYMSAYSVKDFRAKNGLELINAAGAYVRLKSTDFTMKAGGTLTLSFKIPLQKSGQVNIIVKKINGALKTHVKNAAGKVVPFDSLKLNAKKTMITGTSILNGVKSIQFISGGATVHTFEM